MCRFGRRCYLDCRVGGSFPLGRRSARRENHAGWRGIGVHEADFIGRWAGQGLVSRPPQP